MDIGLGIRHNLLCASGFLYVSRQFSCVYLHSTPTECVTWHTLFSIDIAPLRGEENASVCWFKV